MRLQCDFLNQVTAMRRVILLTFCFTFWANESVCFTNQTRCPNKILWKQRARRVCNDKPKWYHCLLDGENDRYVEKCLYPKTYKKGLRIVLNLHMDARPCEASWYSPSRVSSNYWYRCPYIKSYCSEDGQLVSSQGSPDTDKSCRCDFSRGYDYIKRPKDPCLCHPAQEDCSCFVKGRRITDYKCTVGKEEWNIRGEQDEKIFLNYSENNLQSINRKQGSRSDASIVISVLTGIVILAMVSMCIFVKIKFDREPIPSKSKDDKGNPSNINKKGSKDKETRNKPFSYYVDEDESVINEDDKWNYLIKFISSMDKAIMPMSEDEEINDERLSYTGESAIKKVDEVIFHQDIDKIVPNYTETHHLIKVLKFFIKGARLVLLTGPPGAGKTQTAYQYCSRMRGFYTIFAKFEATNDITLFDSIKKLLSELQISSEIDENENATISSLMSSLKVYMKHSNRANRSFLFLIDDLNTLNENIKTIIGLLTHIKPLTILITTYDSTLKYDYTTASIVEHTGMNSSEYLQFFRNSDYFKNMTDKKIEKIAEKIGRLPLALNSARKYIETTRGNIQSYIQQFNETEEKTSLDTIVSPQNPFYKYGLLKSQRIPLSAVKQGISPDHWYVFVLLSSLHFQSISLEVLDACLYHRTKGKKSCASPIIEKCTQFSLCHIKEDQKHCQENTEVLDSEGNTFYSFHTCTIMALRWMNVHQENVDSNEMNPLLFLLKVFCFEMSLDLIDNHSLNRNFLFMSHARKLLRKLDSNEINKTVELTFYLAYLSLVVGKTLKAEETDMTLAHTYLMQARMVLFSIVNCKPGITLAQRPFKGESTSTFQSEMDAFKAISEAVVNETLVREFIFGKRRRREVIKNTTTKSKACYLTETEFSTFDAPSVLRLSHMLLNELLIHILLESGICSRYLRITPGCNYRNIHNASLNELQSCHEFCSLPKVTNPPKLFPFLENEIIGRSYLLLAQYSTESSLDVEEHIIELQKKIGDNEQIVYDFGVPCGSLDSTLNIYSECQLRSMLLKCMLRKQISNSSNNEGVSGTSNCLQIAEDFLGYIDKHEQIMSDWLALPSFYAQCAKVFRVCGNDGYVERAIELYENVITLDKRGQNAWTHNLWKGYFGQIQCYLQLNEPSKAQDICIPLTKKKHGIFHLLPSRPSAYITCGHVMRRGAYGRRRYLLTAKDLFKMSRTIEMKSEKGYICEGYCGEIMCLWELGQHEQAKTVYESNQDAIQNGQQCSILKEVKDTLEVHSNT